MNIREDAIIQSPTEKEEECAKFVIDNIDSPFVLNEVMQKGNEYILGFCVKSEVDGALKIANETIETNENWVRHELKINSDEEKLLIWFKKTGVYYLYHAQLELGNKATDFVESPDDTDEKISKTWTLAEQTADRFRWLVGSGGSETEFTLTDRMATLIAETISLNGDVKVNGDMILDGAVTADKIDVVDLFAQDITATGTISGLNLIGTTGSFDDIRIKDTIKVFNKTDDAEKEIDVIRMEMADDGVTVYVGGNDVTRMILYSEQDITLMQGCKFNADEINCKQVNAYYKILENGVSLEDKYVQPYVPGEKKYVYFVGAGFVTNGGKSVLFTIPLNKPCKGVTNVTIESMNSGGVIIRQAGKYAYGSAGVWIEPASYKATLQNNAITVRAEFDNNTNAVNNDACGIEANIYVNFN